MTTFRGPFADVEIPTTFRCRTSCSNTRPLARTAGAHRWAERSVLTYGALASGVQALASDSPRTGFAPGEVVALFAPNLPEYAVAFHGVLAGGGANTTINSLARRRRTSAHSWWRPAHAT